MTAAIMDSLTLESAPEDLSPDVLDRRFTAMGTSPLFLVPVLGEGADEEGECGPAPVGSRWGGLYAVRKLLFAFARGKPPAEAPPKAVRRSILAFHFKAEPPRDS